MNTQTLHSSLSDFSSADRYGERIARHLSLGANDMPYEVKERLRAARERAVAQRKRTQLRFAPQIATQVQVSGHSATLSFPTPELGWLSKLGSVLPILALLVGLVVIDQIQLDDRAHELAEVDAALLTDDLPPAAYADPGFAQFIQTHATD